MTRTRIKLINDINLMDFFADSRFVDKGDTFEVCDDIFEEWVIVDKNTRLIQNNGFNNMLSQWYINGFIEIINS